MDFPVSDDVFISLAAAPEVGELQIKQLLKRTLRGWQDVDEQSIKASTSAVTTRCPPCGTRWRGWMG